MSPSVDEPETLEEILSRKPNHPTPIVADGILYAKTKMIIYGRYKHLKSMLGLDMAFALASGQDWIGFHTQPSGVRVFYLQLEIPYGLLRTRLDKTWQGRQDHQQPMDHENLRFWTQHFLKLDQATGILMLDYYIEQYKPDVLVVDPLYKVLSGNLLMGLDVQRLLDNLDGMIAKYGLSVVIIAHTRKGMADMGEWGSDDLIGSSYLSNWADTVIKIERRGSDRLAIKFDVVRHAELELDQREVTFNRETLEFNLVEYVKPSTDSDEKEQQ
jgi:RecA-family ATPase